MEEISQHTTIGQYTFHLTSISSKPQFQNSHAQAALLAEHNERLKKRLAVQTYILDELRYV